MKTAVVIGATGLVGEQLTQLLLSHTGYSKVIVFVRRSLALQNTKLEEHVIDFDRPDTWRYLVKGDVFFSCLGTTLKQAGSKEAQYLIDYTYQYEFAEAAAGNGIPVYVLVSSASADPGSRFFYMRMKGELERDVRKLNFESITLIQPGPLAGRKSKKRTGEEFGIKLISAFNAIGLFKKYRPIDGKIVARAMIRAADLAAPGVRVYTLDQVFALEGSE